MVPLRVLELYSGIGGMHCALRECGIPVEELVAVDVNTCANEVYKYNFPHAELWPKTIEGITLEDFNRLAFDVILMSPPCQPFTRIGLQGDVSDPRAKSFLYILEILPRDELIKTLEKCGYQYQEFLLSPTCLGIPNSRLRYFLIAKLKPEEFYFQTTGQILTTFPHLKSERSECCSDGSESITRCMDGKKVETDLAENACSRSLAQDAVLFKLETVKELERKQTQDNDVSIHMLQDYLEDVPDISEYLLTPKSLLRYALILDIVKPTCRRSTCFTKGYGHYVEGTGSVLQTAKEVEIDTVFKSLEKLSDEAKLANLLTLKLRYFTPREIANLHGFPPSFDFPDKITVKQRYRLLGNSLNVHIVAQLISALLR